MFFDLAELPDLADLFVGKDLFDLALEEAVRKGLVTKTTDENGVEVYTVARRN